MPHIAEDRAGYLEAVVLDVKLAGGRSETMELDLETPTGLRIFQVRLAPEFGTGGSFEAVLAIASDVTELKLDF